MTVYVYQGKRGPTYGYRFWFRRRLYERMVGHTYGLAEEAERRERARLEVAAWEGQYGPLTPRLTLWSEAVEWYEKAKADKRSLEYDRYILARWTRYLSERGIHYLQEISPEVLDAAKAELRSQGKAPGTIQRHLSILRALCNLAIKRWRVLRENPVTAIDWPKARTKTFPVPSPEELRRLLEVADPVIRPLILAAIYTGLRAGDLLRLTAEDLLERSGWIRGLGSKPGRVIWLPIATELQKAIDGLAVESGRLFRRPDGTPYARFPRERWDAARQASGLSGLRFHDLRHATGTMLAEAGVPQRVIQMYLGHSTGQVTERYTRPHEEGLLEAARTIGRKMGRPKRKAS